MKMNRKRGRKKRGDQGVKTAKQGTKGIDPPKLDSRYVPTAKMNFYAEGNYLFAVILKVKICITRIPQSSLNFIKSIQNIQIILTRKLWGPREGSSPTVVLAPNWG
jgi:hypothetical protein